MGHSSIGDTAYYLRLTAGSYPQIAARVRQSAGEIPVPPVTGGTGHGDRLRGLPSPLPHVPPGRAPRLLTQTTASYRDTFKLLIAWFRDERSVPPGKLTLDHIDARAVTAFLAWLQEGLDSVSTRNQRLAAISSFCTWMQTEDPARMACWQDILAIPVKKQDQPPVSHLTTEQTRRLLAPPTGPPARAGATRPCWRRSTTPGPGSRNSPTSLSATSASRTRPWPR